MSIIVQILDAIDQHLAAAREHGREPERIILREEIWEEIVERYSDPQADPGIVVGTSYKGVPVAFGDVDGCGFAGLFRLVEDPVAR